MGRTCTVCTHPEGFAINEALVIDKRSNRSIAKHFGVGHSAVQRHREHIPQLLVKALEAEEASRADDLLRQVRALQSKTLSTLVKADGAEDWSTLLKAVREARENVRLLGELHGKLDTHPTVNLHLHPEWVEMKALIVGALEPYPEARYAVVGALEEADNGKS